MAKVDDTQGQAEAYTYKGLMVCIRLNTHRKEHTKLKHTVVNKIHRIIDSIGQYVSHVPSLIFCATTGIMFDAMSNSRIRALTLSSLE